MPLYGDMQIAPFNYVMRTKNYESSKWPACNSQAESIQGKILDQVDKIRNEHNSYISELAKYSNEVNFYLFAIAQQIPQKHIQQIRITARIQMTPANI